MEKTIVIRQTEITFSIWDLGGITMFRHTQYKQKKFNSKTYRPKGVCQYVAFGV